MNYQDILQKYADSSISPAERQEFTYWLKTLPEEEYYKVLMAYEEIMARQEVALPYDPGLLDTINARIAEQERQSPSLLRIDVRFRTAAAAVLLLVLGGGLYFGLGYRAASREGVEGSVTEQIKRDIPPGRIGAILTLADGRQIVLDSAGNGILEQQGGARLHKQGAQLSYEAVAAAQQEVMYNTMSTLRGTQYQLRLPDGTKVWLNAASSIKFPTAFPGKERRVEVAGEAYFEVAADKARPFIVHTRKAEIAVVGTQFDVADFEEEPGSTVTLIEGAVRVSGGTQQKALRPGQQGRIEKATGLLSVRQVDVDPVIAWTKGQLSLGNSDLPGLMRQISRWYDIDVKFQGAIPDLHIGGMIDRNVYLSTVLEYLGDNGLHYKLEGKTLIILP